MRKTQDAGVGGELRDDEDLPIDLEREHMDQGAPGSWQRCWDDPGWKELLTADGRMSVRFLQPKLN